LGIQPDEELEILDSTFSLNEFNQKIAEFFNSAIRIAIVQKLGIRRKVPSDQYIEIMMETKFNDPKFMSFVIKVANNLALLVLQQVSIIEAGVLKTS